MECAGAVVILLGPPGAGKGTQAELISRCLGIPAVSTGEMLRKECQSGSEVGRQVQDLLTSGQLVPDELMRGVITNRLSERDCKQGFILDGYPRTVAQARILDSLLQTLDVAAPIVFDLIVDADELIQRLGRRRQCVQCGGIISVADDSSRPSYCERDGADLFRRADDNPSTIRQRLLLYRRNIGELVRFYRSRNYYRIAASRPAEIVTAEMTDILKTKLFPANDYKLPVGVARRVYA